MESCSFKSHQSSSRVNSIKCRKKVAWLYQLLFRKQDLTILRNTRCEVTQALMSLSSSCSIFASQVSRHLSIETSRGYFETLVTVQCLLGSALESDEIYSREHYGEKLLCVSLAGLIMGGQVMKKHPLNDGQLCGNSLDWASWDEVLECWLPGQWWCY